MAIRHWAIVACTAITVGMPAAGYGQGQKLTWAEAVDYVAQRGSASSFYGPVAMSLGLSNGTTVEYRTLSKPGNPSRDFYVTKNAVVLSVTWRSGASLGYTASKQGLLLNAVERNRPIPLAQAAGAFEAEKQWWISAISVDKPKAGY
jgi:hypothetical protein